MVSYEHSHTLQRISKSPRSAGVYRVSESLMHSTAWCRMYFPTLYTSAPPGVDRMLKRSFCTLLNGIVKIYVCQKSVCVCAYMCMRACERAHTCVYARKRERDIVHIFSHSTYLSRTCVTLRSKFASSALSLSRPLMGVPFSDRKIGWF